MSGCIPERFFCSPEDPSWDVLAQISAAPIFTPTTKAEQGQHDEPMTYADVEALVGSELAAKMRAASLALYALLVLISASVLTLGFRLARRAA